MCPIGLEWKVKNQWKLHQREQGSRNRKIYHSRRNQFLRSSHCSTNDLLSNYKAAVKSSWIVFVFVKDWYMLASTNTPCLMYLAFDWKSYSSLCSASIYYSDCLRNSALIDHSENPRIFMTLLSRYFTPITAFFEFLHTAHRTSSSLTESTAVIALTLPSIVSQNLL